MNITQLPSGSYRIRQMVDGKTYSKTLSYKPSELEAYQVITEMIKTRKWANLCFSDACEEYINSKTEVLSASTIKGYWKMTRSISDDFKLLDIEQITGNDIQNEINRHSANHSAKTVRNLNGFISAVLTHFGCKPNTSITLPRKRQNEAYTPTHEDVSRILAYLLNKNSPATAAIWLCSLGMRKSEVCALTIDDLEGQILTINKALIDGKLQPPKTEPSNRKITIPLELADLIRKQGFIWKSHPDGLYKALESAQRHLNIQHFGLHRLRHYFATECIYNDIPIMSIELYGGWARNSATLQRVYTHYRLEQEYKNQQKILEVLMTNRDKSVSNPLQIAPDPHDSVPKNTDFSNTFAQNCPTNKTNADEGRVQVPSVAFGSRHK